MGRNVIVISNSLYCKLIRGNAQRLSNVNHALMGINSCRARIEGSEPAEFVV